MQIDDLPPLPEPWIRDFSAAPDAQHHFALDQMQERDQMWLARIAALQAENDKLRADAERYRLVRRKVCIVGTPATFHFLNLPSPTYVAPDAAVEFDAAIDAARASVTGDSNG